MLATPKRAADENFSAVRCNIVLGEKKLPFFSPATQVRRSFDGSIKLILFASTSVCGTTCWRPFIFGIAHNQATRLANSTSCRRQSRLTCHGGNVRGFRHQVVGARPGMRRPHPKTLRGVQDTWRHPCRRRCKAWPDPFSHRAAAFRTAMCSGCVHRTPRWGGRLRLRRR